MNKKKMSEIRTTLNFLKNGRAATEQMSESDCLEIYGISKAQALANMNAGIAKYESKLGSAEQPLTGIDRKLAQIAAKHITAVAERGALETRHNGAEDFFEVSVWSLKAALKAAYDAGCRSK